MGVILNNDEEDSRSKWVPIDRAPAKCGFVLVTWESRYDRPPEVAARKNWDRPWMTFGGEILHGPSHFSPLPENPKSELESPSWINAERLGRRTKRINRAIIWGSSVLWLLLLSAMVFGDSTKDRSLSELLVLPTPAPYDTRVLD